MKLLDSNDIKAIRAQFPMLRNTLTMQGKRFCYLDTSATSLKPDRVIEASDSFYRFWNANTHRGDYDIAHKADVNFSKARAEVANFIGAKPEEVVFTSGCTDSLNKVALGLADYFQPGDEIVIDRAEHASNVLPWFKLARDRGVKIVFAPLNERGEVTPAALKGVLTAHTKLVSIARVTNVFGSFNDVESICRLCRAEGIFTSVDAAQSIACESTDVKRIGCDFLSFSGHKMYGPTGIGALYVRSGIKGFEPGLLGGGMNARFYTDGTWTLEDAPYRFEPGTQNIAGAAGLAEACRFILEIGVDRIGEYENRMRNLIRDSVKDVPGITIYNPDSHSGIFTFSLEGVPAQDEGTLLNSRGICVRSGLHCAKILPGIPADGTIRASLGVYTDEEDCQQLIEALRKGGSVLDAYFA